MLHLRHASCALLVLLLAVTTAAGAIPEAMEAARGQLDEAEAEILQTALRGEPVDSEALAATLDKLDEAFETLRESDLDRDIEWPETGTMEPPEWYEGANPLVAAAAVKLSDAYSGSGGEKLDEAVKDAVAVRKLLRPISRGPGTFYWFDAANAEIGLMQRLGGRLRDMTAEQLDAVAAELPPLRPFPESTQEEGRRLAEDLRQSEELPQWVLESAEREEVPASEIERWKQDWADPETKKRLINEFELYYAVEVEMGGKRGTEEFEQALQDWELAHERESYWLSRYTLMTPRTAYSRDALLSATSDLFAAAVAGVKADDLAAAAEAAGVRLVSQPGVDFLVKDNVPLSDEPAVLAIND